MATKANRYSKLTNDVQAACASAAEQLGAKPADVEGFFLAGGDWDADTPEALADLIVVCWREAAEEQHYP